MNIELLKKITIINLLYALPLIISSRLYVDDIFRATSGWMGYWNYDARPFVVYVMKLLNIGSVISDISPLPLILSISLMSITSCFVASRVTHKTNWLVAFASSLLCLSPLYIENLSFSFDGVTISIAVFLAIFSAGYEGRFSIPFKALLIFIMLGMYQPAISSYIGMSAIVFVTSLNNKTPIKKAIVDGLYNLLALVASYSLYRPIISKLFPESDYFFKKGESIGGDYLSTLSYNLMNSIESIYHWIGVYFLISFAMFTIAILLISIKVDNKKSKIPLIVFGGIAIAFSAIGPIIATKNPVILPRVFVGYSLVICFSSLLFVNVERLRFVPVVLVVMSFLCMYSYNGAMRGEENRNIAIAQDIQYLVSSAPDKISEINISGNAGRSSIAIQAEHKYPLLTWVVPRYFSTPRLSGAFLSLHGIDIPVRSGGKEISDSSRTSMFFHYNYNKGSLNLVFKSVN